MWRFFLSKESLVCMESYRRAKFFSLFAVLCHAHVFFSFVGGRHLYIYLYIYYTNDATMMEAKSQQRSLSGAVQPRRLQSLRQRFVVADFSNKIKKKKK